MTKKYRLYAACGDFPFIQLLNSRAGTRGAADRIVPKNNYRIVIMTIILELPVTAATAALLLFFRKKGDSD